ncbi:hypothetical protein LGH82_31400 [Mesorhizobium sp. PAMC28654]|uniref:hypothetical protein n=1 Tax=Mesorhizobium sp. PAMC28654 TaxID=2880934 RepID=UPI001D0BCC3F|nr:hypothetical protein [Mesorhizobium sp. PAMC28654]UDL89508.1 hypothetical protein LGH82_31400 [Mesorhizobium sp. PAMC28654]
MVHIIPLSIAQRRLDTGNAVQYPQGSPIGGAMQGFGDQLSAVAERYQQMKDQQEAFDAELARRRFNGQVAQAEDEVAANAPADGSGLHETMYGQVDPRSGRVVKTGLFDTLFDDALPNMPASQRAAFAMQKEPMRMVGARRMAQRQRQSRQDYEQAEVDTVLKTRAIAIGQANPDDAMSFEAARQEGLDLIAKMGLDPGIRQQKVKDWFSTAAKTRFEALIAKDPKRALEIFGVGTPAFGSDASSFQPMEWIRVSGSSDAAAAEGDRVGRLTADERVAQAFRDEIPPEDRPLLLQQARTADAVRQVEMRTSIGLAELNAPAAIRETGLYSGPTFTPEQFVTLYGSTEGIRRSQAFNQALDVSRQFYAMRTMSNDTVRTVVKESAPKVDSATPEKDRARHDAIVTAADLTFKERQGDPGGYVRKTFANLDAAWNNPSTPEAYQAAIIGSIAAQQHLGIETVQPLPNSVAEDIGGKLTDKALSPQDKKADLSSVLQATPPGFQQAMFHHLLPTSVAKSNERRVNDGSFASLVSPEKLTEATEFARRAVSGKGPKPEWLTGYAQTNQEWLGELIAGDSERGSLRRFLAQKLVGSDGLGEDGISVADATPLALSFALEKAANAALDGNYGEALLNVAEVIPFEKLAGKALRQAGKVAKHWEESPSKFPKRPIELIEGGQALVRGVDAETLRFQQAIARSISPRIKRRRARRGEIPENAFNTALLASLIARDPSAIKYAGAKVGWAKSKNYRKTFFDANPTLNRSDYVVHHSVEQRINKKYPNLFTNEELNSIENLRGIRKEFDINLHLKVIRSEWDEFYKTHATATRQQVLDYATHLDKKYGHLFDPPIGD